MKPHELIRHSFRHLTPSADFEARVIQAVQQSKRRHSVAPRILIAAAVILTLVLSAGAVGYRLGWLDGFLETGGDSLEPTPLGASAAAKNGLTVSLDRIYIDDPFLYLQATFRGPGDEESDLDGSFGIDFTVSMTDSLQNTPYIFIHPSIAYRTQRIDDGTDPAQRSYTVAILLDYDPASLEFLRSQTLCLTYRLPNYVPGSDYPEFGEVLVSAPITLTADPNRREAQLQDGTRLRISSIGVQVQGFAFFERFGAKYGSYDLTEQHSCGVILEDGSRVAFSMGTLRMPYDTEDAYKGLSLSAVIDPNAVVAIYVDDEVFSIQ